LFTISVGSGSSEHIVGIALDLVGVAFIQQNMQKVLVSRVGDMFVIQLLF
jgi:hypothetical protein